VDLGGVEVYIDGIRIPLVFVSPTQINAQVPFELVDTNSSSLFVRTTNADGSITVSDAIGLPIAPDNPGIFAQPGIDPRVALAYHASSYASASLTVSGGINAGDTATIGVQSRVYNYVVQSIDTLDTVRDALISLINANPEEQVTATAAGVFDTILLTAKVPGPEGNSIAVSGTSTGPSSDATAVSITITTEATTLCCANVAGAPITVNNPALAGETIYILATGLGLVGPNEARDTIVDGQAYTGPVVNFPESAVSALAGGAAANVLSAGLEVGGIGIYKVTLQLDNGVATNSAAQISISQDVYTSNVVTIPIYNPNPSTVSVCN
jgi:hypothetical protein